MTTEEKAILENSLARIEEALRALLQLHPVHLLNPAKEAVNQVTIEVLKLQSLLEK